jgi:cytochrome c-type biogenesis protein CcmE
MSARRRQRAWLMGGAFTCLALATSLLAVVFRDNIVFFYTPTECLEKACPQEQSLRLGGLVQKGSVTHTLEGQVPTVRFTVTDEKNHLRVVYAGLLPDLFREGQGVVVEGTFDKTPQGVPLFKAQSVLAKHDETYRPPSSSQDTLSPVSKEALEKSLARS